MKQTEAQLTTGKRGWSSDDGRSIIETVLVVAIAALLVTIAVPQFIAGRRQMRSATLPREIMTQLRYARQLAMTHRQAVTFQYDDSIKTIRIFDHNNNNNANPACVMKGYQVLSASGYPNTACTTTVVTIPLAISVTASEITYGVPTGLNGNLSDGTTMTALVGGNVNVTFQSNGTVVNSSDNYVNRSLFLYNSQMPNQSAAAISVLGASGRVKVWRYSTSASQYAE